MIDSAETLPNEEDADADADADAVAAILAKLLELIDSHADDMRADPLWSDPKTKTPQQWGTEIHARLEKSLKAAISAGELILAEGFDLRVEESLKKGEAIKRDRDGNIVWAPRGTEETFRPDVIITQRVNGKETIIMVLDLKTGKARISKAWREGLQALFYGQHGSEGPMDAPIQPIRPTNPKRFSAGVVTLEEGDLPWD